MIRVLIATVPSRRASVQCLLEALAKQSLVPDTIDLVLDGYGQVPAPLAPSPLDRSVRLWRTDKPTGPGNRWRACDEMAVDDVVVVLDDDVLLAGPKVIEGLAEPVVRDEMIATSASGFTGVGGYVGWGARYSNFGTYAFDGKLVALVSNAMAARAGNLRGLRSWVNGLSLPFDVLGRSGDDEAAVSALLWARGVAIQHVQIDGLAVMPGTQEDCETSRRRMVEKRWDWQRSALRASCKWPWPTERILT